MDDMTVAVGHDLKLNMARVNDQLLEVNFGVSESLFRLDARALKRLHQTYLVMRGAHSATAPAGNGIDHHRITDLSSDLDRFGLGLTDSVANGRNRHAAFPRTSARGILVTHQAHRRRRRPDELDLAALADLGEMRVLGQKSVARMNSIHVAHFRRAHDAIDLEITVGTRR